VTVRRWVIAGTLIALSVVMFFVGGGVFASATDVSPAAAWIGGICFFGWWVPGLLGSIWAILDRRKS
jgi:hypothetical protein